MNMKQKYYISGLLLVALTCSTGCEANKKKEEITMPSSSTIVSLPSGLRYEVLNKVADSAISPKKGQQVSVHYSGYLNDGNDGLGKKFDSSVDRGQAFVFQIGVGQVISGWDQGVALMKKGQKVRFYIPSNLGYGSRGAGNLIPGNADLIFDVELLDMK